MSQHQVETPSAKAVSNHENGEVVAMKLVNSTELELISRGYDESARLHGVTAARKNLLAHAFATWHSSLQSGQEQLDTDAVCRLAVGMVKTLAARDALILSLVDCGGNAAVLLEYAVHPHDPENVRYLYRLLDGAFNNADTVPQVPWCSCGVRMLKSMATMLPQRYAVGPMTVLAYVLWWMNDDEAAEYACRALDIDDECTLARIVCIALDRGLRPAWCT